MKKHFKKILAGIFALGIVITIDHFSCNWISGSAKIEITTPAADSATVKEMSPDTIMPGEKSDSTKK